MFSLRSSLYPHYGHTEDALWILMMLYPNIVEARRGRRSIKTITIPARTIVWSLVFVVLLFIYFSVTNISESGSVKYFRLLKFFSSHFASYLRGVGCCVRDNQLLSNLQNQCFLSTRPECGPGCCHCQYWSPPTISHQLGQRTDGELLLILESGSSISSSAYASVSSLQVY